MRKYLSWAAVILWMALIFLLSSQPAERSEQLSTGITQAIINTVDKIVPNAEFIIGNLNHIVRKNAHFFAYLILGLLISSALAGSGVSGIRRVILATAVCVLYAVSDEVHQLFVPGRGAMVTDVLIDSAGAISGIGINSALLRRRPARDDGRLREKKNG